MNALYREMKLAMKKTKIDDRSIEVKSPLLTSFEGRWTTIQPKTQRITTKESPTH